MVYKVINLGKLAFESKDKDRATKQFFKMKNYYERKAIYFKLQLLENENIVIEKVGK